MDPAGPCFVNAQNSDRLDESDADFVDVIHTQSEGILTLGSNEILGTEISKL